MQAFVFSLVEPPATVTFSSVPSVPEIVRPVTVTDADAAGAAAPSSARVAMVARITIGRLPGLGLG
jgi:hypothetical protein